MNGQTDTIDKKTGNNQIAGLTLIDYRRDDDIRLILTVCITADSAFFTGMQINFTRS